MEAEDNFFNESMDVIGDRMKKYEEDIGSSSILKANKPFLVRLDGHRFSKFTSGFKKPYDDRIFKAMLYTTKDLIEEFQPIMGYTQSDEITLVFPALTTEQIEAGEALKFNGRIQKLVSLMSGYCSVRFAFNLCAQAFHPDTEKQLVDKVHKAYFDARVFHLPSNEEILTNIMWRISDVKRNGVNNLGHNHFTQKEMEGLSPKEVIKKLSDKGIEWSSMPNQYKYGVIVKKGSFMKEGFNPMTSETVTVQRTRMCYCSVDTPALKGALGLITQKLANDCAPMYQFFTEIE